MKKILIILGAVILVLVVSGVIVANKTKENPRKVYYQIWRTHLFITTLPIKITNMIAPPSIKGKSKEEARKIVRKLLKKYNEVGEKWQIPKAMSMLERILKIGNPIVPVLSEIISDKKEEKTIRKVALAAVLGLIGEYKTTPWEELCEHKWQEDLLRGPWKLAQKINIDEAVPAIIGLLQEEDIELKELAIETLGKIKNRRAVEPLIKLLDDKTLCIRRRNWTIADVAADALWDIGDERAIEPMIKAGYYGWRGKVSKEYREKAIKLWREALEKLPESEEHKYERICLLEALGKAGDSEAVSALIKWLEREREKERITGEYGFQSQIFMALGAIGNDEAVEVLIKSLDRFKEGNYRGGGFLIKALGNTKSKKAIKPLERLLNDKYVGEFAAEALKKITGKEIPIKVSK